MVETNRLDALSLALSAAALSAAMMLLLGIGWNAGVYTGAAEMMAQWHLFFGPSAAGILGGMIEAAIHGFVWIGLLAWVYNGIVSLRAGRVATARPTRA